MFADYLGWYYPHVRKVQGRFKGWMNEDRNKSLQCRIRSINEKVGSGLYFILLLGSSKLIYFNHHLFALLVRHLLILGTYGTRIDRIGWLWGSCVGQFTGGVLRKFYCQLRYQLIAHLGTTLISIDLYLLMTVICNMKDVVHWRGNN